MRRGRRRSGEIREAGPVGIAAAEEGGVRAVRGHDLGLGGAQVRCIEPVAGRIEEDGRRAGGGEGLQDRRTHTERRRLAVVGRSDRDSTRRVGVAEEGAAVRRKVHRQVGAGPEKGVLDPPGVRARVVDDHEETYALHHRRRATDAVQDFDWILGYQVIRGNRCDHLGASRIEDVDVQIVLCARVSADREEGRVPLEREDQARAPRESDALAGVPAPEVVSRASEKGGHAGCRRERVAGIDCARHERMIVSLAGVISRRGEVGHARGHNGVHRLGDDAVLEHWLG